jgi:hypothetical protein
MRASRAITPAAADGRRATRPRRWAAVALVAALVSTTMSPIAAQGQRVGQSRDELVAKLAGKKVRVDRTTGALREITVDEAREFVDTIAAMTALAPPVEQVSPTGTAGVMAALGDHTGHVMVARPNPDGTTSLRCVGGAEEAVEFLVEETDR